MEFRRFCQQVRRMIQSFLSSYLFFMTITLLFQSYLQLSVSIKLSCYFFLSLVIQFLILFFLFGIYILFGKLFRLLAMEDPVNLSSRDGQQQQHPAWLQQITDFLFQQTSSFSSSTSTRTPPTMEQLQHMEQCWTHTFETDSVPSSSSPSVNTEESITTCLICLQVDAPSSAHLPSSMKTRLPLKCQCQQIFHKKCILEWFYFGERESETDRGRYVVTCPSCRHVFTRSPT